MHVPQVQDSVGPGFHMVSEMSQGLSDSTCANVLNH